MKRYIRFVLAAGALLFGVNNVAIGQEGEELQIENYCCYYGEIISEEIYGFPPDNDAKEAIEALLHRAGSLGKFELYAANVPNAVATMVGKKQAILYNQKFIKKVMKSTGKDWVALGIFAHEMAHHTQGHLLGEQGKRRKFENDADYYSGFLLYQLGASEEQAQAAVNKIASEEGTSTHPPKSARLAAVTSGWRTAASVKEEIKDADATEGDSDEPTLQKSQKVPIEPPRRLVVASEEHPTPNLTATVTMNNSRYFLTSGGLIIGPAVGNQRPMTFGRKGSIK